MSEKRRPPLPGLDGPAILREAGKLLDKRVDGLIVAPASSNYIWRFFCRITDPFLALIAPITPRAVAPVVLWLFGVVWLFWLRFAYYIALRLFGVNIPT